MAVMKEIPVKTGGTVDNRQLLNYLLQLEEEIRYALGHLDGENLTDGAIGENQLSDTVKGTMEGLSSSVQKVVEDTSGLEKKVRETATKVEQTEEQVEILAQETVQLGNQVEENAAAIETQAGQIALMVTRTEIEEDGVPKVSNAAVLITSNGMVLRGGVILINAGSVFRVSSGGTFEVFAADDNSYIKFGGTQASPNFSLGLGGNVKAKSIYTESLEVSGGGIPQLVQGSLAEKIYVGSSQPAGHGILWLKPGASGGSGTVDFSAAAAGEGMSGTTATATITLTRSGSALSGSTCSYGVKFRIYNYSGTAYWTSVTVTARRSDGVGGTITVFSGAPVSAMQPGDYFAVDTLGNPASGLDNITGGSSILLTVTVVKSGSTQARFEYETITLRCTGSGSSGGAQLCEPYYIA